MRNTLWWVGALLAAGLAFFATLPVSAASLQLVPDWGASGVPTNLSMYVYVPDKVATNPPVLVLLHYWGGTASSVFGQAAGGGLVAAADEFGFIMVVPQRAADCWDYASAQSLTHDGGGETQGIAQMVKYAVNTYQANSNRVYVTGDSCGGMMTEALLAVYPDIFKAGVAYAGVPIGGAWTPVTHTAQEWGNLARAAYPGYTGPRPRVQLWHGTADGLVNYSNLVEATMQWGNVLGLSISPTLTNAVYIPGVTNLWTHQVWRDTNGAMRLDAWSDIGGDHGPSDALFKARYVIPFLGLDQVGPVDPQASGQRGRPKLNAARTTFVADNGQPLRGPYTSTEWTGATDYTNIAKMKALGFNAVHLYGESFDPSYPTNGSTAPGYALSRIDSIVQSTRDLGLYLVITIGNGAYNGDYNLQYVTNFWKLYSGRYANETHVIFEIQNEPVAWGPPYSAANATPPGALDMEIAAYQTIRQYAPDTPVLLFSYSVLGGTGGATSALTDIQAFNQAVFGNQNAVWTNAAVGFHGYAGAAAFEIAVSNILKAGYPCFQTEFGDGTWGGSGGGLDVEGVAILERLGVSWLAFTYIPPTGVSDDVSQPEVYSNRVVNAGLSWSPDYGTFPLPRSVYGNGGRPWTAPDYTNNLLGGTLRIEAENFDNGGPGIAYANTNGRNVGGPYRTNETVRLETTSDVGGGYDVSGTAAGDWLEYTMKIPQAGTYNLRLRVAGAGSGSIQVLARGAEVTGKWMLPATGGAQIWQTVTNSIFLVPGQQKLHLDVLAGGFNLNWLELSPATTGPLPDGTYKFYNAASAQALDLNTNNVVVTAPPASTNSQQWTIRHIGGGQYQVNSAAKGNSWYTWGAPLHLLPWGWGAGGDTCFIIQPTGGGYYRFCSAGGGKSLEPSTSNPPTLADNPYTGAAAQQWGILAPSAPQFPGGLIATPTSATQASLTWNAVAGASGYNVKRSITSGGPYTVIAAGVTATNFADAGLVSSLSYYYVVSAVIGAGESLNSLAAGVLPPWQWQDIGAPGVAGITTYSNGVFGLAGSGADIWGTADAFRFAYVTASGNCTIVARVTGVQNVDSWSKAGVMIRSGLTANAANALIAVTPGNGVTWQTRATAGAATGNSAAAGLSAPYWVKLVRSGNTFTGYRSANGVTWTQQGAATTITMGTTVYVGLALTSHNNTSAGTAVFDNVSVPGWTAPSLAPVGLVATTLSASQIALVWNSLTNATSYNVKRSLNSGGPYAVIASGVAATNYLDPGLAGGTVYYYLVSGVVAGSETPDSLPATATTLSPAEGALVHRYRFSETSGTSIADSVGGPVWSGSLPNGGTFASDCLTLTAASSQYANLPGGIVGGLSNFTMVTWVRLNSTASWSRFWDFGSGQVTNMFITPQNGADGHLRFSITTNGGGSEQQINSSAMLTTGVLYQVAVTLNGNTGVLYLNGNPVGTNNAMTLWPWNLGNTVNNYLGRSQYPDPYFDGMIDEFRIYNTALTAAEIAATAALGTDQQLSTNRPPMTMTAAGTNLTMSWPLACAGYWLQSRTNLGLGNWAKVATPAPQISGSNWLLTVPQSGSTPTVFYRLVK